LILCKRNVAAQFYYWHLQGDTLYTLSTILVTTQQTG